MKRLGLLRIAAIAGVLFAPFRVSHAQQQPIEPDPIASATELFNAGGYIAAAAGFERFISDNPNSGLVESARCSAGYAYLLSQQYDKAIERLEPVIKAGSAKVQAPVLELASFLLPEAYSGKAAALAQDDPNREAMFKAAAGGFDQFLAKYPQSLHAEAALFDGGTAYFQIKDFQAAGAKLSEYIRLFPQGDQAPDAEFLLALALFHDAAETLRRETEDGLRKQARDRLNEAERILLTIVTRGNDLSLINDSCFQLGEIYYLKAQTQPAGQKSDLLRKARQSFAKVQGKEPLIQAQKKKIESIRAQLQKVLQTASPQERVSLLKRINAILDRESKKLVQLEQKAAPKPAAELRVAEMYFQEAKYDEARILFRHLRNLVAGEQEKKHTEYHIAISYALQVLQGKSEPGSDALVAKASAAYEKFKSAYIDAAEKKNPTASYLPAVVGEMYLREPNRDSEKAIRYLQEGLALYPTSPATAHTMLQLIEAYRLKGDSDAGASAIESLLRTSNDPVVTRTATLIWGKLLLQQANTPPVVKDEETLDAAIGKFRELIKQYPDSLEAETAWVGLVEALAKKDPAQAAAEAEAYQARYPSSANAPRVLLLGAAGLQASGNSEDAKKLFDRIIKDYSDSSAAVNAYFSLAAIARQKEDHFAATEILAEFIKNTPQDPRIADAYFQSAYSLEQIKNPDLIAQLEKAIAQYTDFQAKHPEHPRAPEALLKAIRVRERILRTLSGRRATNPVETQGSNEQMSMLQSQVEALLGQYPESDQVAATLAIALEVQKKRSGKPEEAVTYLEMLRGKHRTNAQLHSKISFVLAGQLAATSPTRAAAIMKAIYREDLKYSPQDLELFANQLAEAGELEAAAKIYQKIEDDFATDKQAKDAQIMATAGKAKLAFAAGDSKAGAESIAKFQKLTQGQPRTRWHSEIDLLSIEDAFKENNEEEVIRLATALMRDQEAQALVQARALYFAASMYEKSGKIKEAADHYRKVSIRYGNLVVIASEALYRCATLLEMIAAAEPLKAQKALILNNARKAYRSILAEFGATKWADMAHERLQAMR